MNGTTRLEQALRSLAEAGGEPDEDVAWEAIEAAMTARGGARRRRVAILASTAAIAAAAAAFVAVTLQPETNQAVEVGPADPTTADDPTTTPEDDQPERGAPVALPEDAAVTVTGRGAMLHLEDAGSGEHVRTILSNLPEDERVVEATITATGDIYLVLAIPESTILARTRWDADSYEVMDVDGPVLREGGGFSAVAVDPRGDTLAFAVHGLDGDDAASWRSAIGILDLGSGRYRQIEWPAGDPRGVLHGPDRLSFSPDGRELAFVNTHDTDGTDLFEAYVVDLTTAKTLADARLVGEEVLDVVFGPDGRVHGLSGVPGDRRFEVLEGGGRPFAPLPRATAIARTSGGSIIAFAEEDGWFRHVPGADPDAADGWLATGWKGWHD